MPAHVLMRVAKRLLRPFRDDWQTRIQRDVWGEVQRAVALSQPGFPATLALPEKYGRGLPERVVELLLAGLIYRPGASVLDVGHANAMPCHLNLIRSLPPPKNITGIDIAEPVFDVFTYYQKSVRADVAKTGMDGDQFDCVWCISAIEHFGMDNSGYTNDFERENDLDIRAVGEMLRLLKKSGTLLITVPYGKYEEHGWLRNYDQHRWQELLGAARPQATVGELYFRHTYGNGWTTAPPEELRYVGYYDQANAGAGGLAAALIVKL